MRRRHWFGWNFVVLCAACAVLGVSLLAAAPQAPAAAQGKAPVHGRAVQRLLIKNAMVVYGNAKPAFGPVDILVQDGLIARVGSIPPKEQVADAVIDATGKYVLPGFVNGHIHLHDERGGVPEPLQYEMNLYLAAGVTTVRDCGTDLDKAKQWRAASQSREMAAPRILIYTTAWRTGETVAQVRQGVRDAKARGADGLKCFGIDRDLLEALIDEGKKVGLRTAIHMAVEETTARDFAELGGTSIEHFYGVPDAAFDGIQDFPPEHNASNEVHRFGRAGELHLQHNINPGKLDKVLDLMVEKNVFWVPTMTAYVASRDLIRGQNLPWYRVYLHPVMEDYWKPDLSRHGSYFLGWTSAQEARWKRNLRVWMDLQRAFVNKGGQLVVADDAGYIYNLYGFGMLQEMELEEEAGFHPLEIIKHATVNGAKLIGMEDRLGRVRQGFIADLIVVNGNPLENLHLLNPFGTDVVTLDGKPISNYGPIVPGDPRIKIARGCGIEWTIKEGVPYSVPQLMKEVKDMVDKARAERSKKAPAQ